jgi:hypothetical protein
MVVVRPGNTENPGPGKPANSIAVFNSIPDFACERNTRMTDTAPENPAREHTPIDEPCDECGAAPGEACLPYCTAPFGPGGPYELADPADYDTPGARG